MKKQVTFLSLLAIFSLACIHPPRSYKGSVEEKSQQAIIFHHDGREELILKVDYKLTPKSKYGLPSSLAWVVPVPEAPDHYSVEDNAIFEELFKLTDISSIEYGADGTPLKDRSGGIDLLQKVTVGEYEIQPIKAKGKEAGPALNKWLSKNEFGEVPVENMEYYLKNDFTFLAIKIHPQKSNSPMAQAGGFSPLRISFKTKHIYFPLKFSSHQGTFDVTLYVITEKGLPKGERGQPDDNLKKLLTSYGFEYAFMSAEVTKEMESMKYAGRDFKVTKFNELWQKINTEGRMLLTGGVLNKLFGKNINSSSNPVSKWEKDFIINLDGSSEK